MIASATELHENGHTGDRPARLRARRSSKLRWPGWVFIVTSIFLAIGAFNGQNNLLFFTFGLSVSAILLSGLISGSALMGLRVHRSPTRAVAVGGGGSIGYTVTNRNRYLPLLGLLIDEIVEPGENGTDASVEASPALVTCLRAGETARVRLKMTGTRSGVVRLRGLRVRSSMPFGLLKKRIDFETPAEVEVHPAVLPVRGARSRSTGNRRTPVAMSSRQVGGDEEFLGVREFMQGDSSRKIAWARSAAHDSLVVRTNARPRPETLWISLDPRAESSRDRELVLTAAASVAADRIRQGLAVGIEVPEWGVSMPPRGGREQLTRILSMLARRRGPAMSDRVSIAGERVSIGAGGGSNGTGSRVVATEVESWLAARGALPSPLRETDPKRTRRRWIDLRLRESGADDKPAGGPAGTPRAKAVPR